MPRSAPDLGMKCMDPCGTRLTVIDSMGVDEGRTILRIRKCPKCGQYYKTEEHRVTLAKGSPTYLRRWKDRIIREAQRLVREGKV